MLIDESAVDQGRVEADLNRFLFHDRNRNSAVRLLDADWPQAALLRVLLVEYASLGLVGRRNVPIIFTALGAGITVYTQKIGTKPDWVRLASVIDMTAKVLTEEIVSKRVESSRGKIWTPYSGVTLQHWLSREKSGVVQEEKTVTEDCMRKTRSAILGQLLDELPEAVVVSLNGT